MKKTTSHLGFAAYLLTKNYAMLQDPTKEQGGRFAFYFDVDSTQLDTLYASFLTSDFKRYDSALIELKKKLGVAYNVHNKTS